MNKKLVYGIGINDSEEPVTKKVSGVRIWIDPAYRCWQGMMSRCYCESTKTNQPQYSDANVCDEWLRFSNFKNWFHQQDWHGKHLTKDVVNGDNNTYSPDNCAFVTKQVRMFLSDFASHGENEVVGVTVIEAGFVAYCRNPIKRDSGYLGLFKTKEEAEAAYMEKKAEYSVMLASVESDERVRNILVSKYHQGVVYE